MWFHTLSPFAVRLTESFGVRWYGLSYVAGFLIAYALMRWMARRGLTLIPIDRVTDALMWLVLGTLVGGRLGYCLFYDRSLFSLVIDAPPWWGVLAINHGGMASHGAVVGLILACWRISRGWRGERGGIEGRCSWLHVMDVAAFIAPPGVMLGRLANFVNGELLGRIVADPGQKGPWWSVQYPHELGLPASQLRQTPEQWAEIERLAAQAAPGRTLGQGIDALVAQSSKYADQLRPLISARAPSQLVQAACEGVLLGIVLWLAWMTPRKPGVISGVFLLGYGLQRIGTEFVRLPDAHLAVPRPMGLTYGQWLSVAIIAIGATVLLAASRSKASVIGGWRVRSADPSR